ncbi:MAG TPA: pyridoxal-5'-phosphate-dependent protein subunit beta, partial [Clostridia bacterium]|nr:pyridoxal-5'-phosphate-dependent protein subunit beta [Clostridia bacterium]
YLETEDFVLERWFKDIFLGIDERHIYDFRSKKAKEQLFKQKEMDWLPFGYSKEYLDSMRDQSFWDEEYNKVFEYNKKIAEMRK